MDLVNHYPINCEETMTATMIIFLLGVIGTIQKSYVVPIERERTENFLGNALICKHPGLCRDDLVRGVVRF